MKRSSVSFGSLSSFENSANELSTNVDERVNRSAESSRHETDCSGNRVVDFVPDVDVHRRGSSGIGELCDGSKVDYRRESLGSSGATSTRRGSAIDFYQNDLRRMSSLSALSNFQVNSVAALSKTLFSEQSLPAQKKYFQYYSLKFVTTMVHPV